MAGGILWLIIVSFVIIGAVIRYQRNKRAANSAAVQLSDIRSGATEAEALPDAPSYGAAVNKTLPNSEGIVSSRMSLLLGP